MEDTSAGKLSYVPYRCDYANRRQAVPLSETTVPLEGDPVTSPAPSVVMEDAVVSPRPGSEGKYCLVRYG